MTNENNGKKPGFLQVVTSVLAAMFGVRSGQARERDFRHGKAAHYIVIGLIMTVVFVLVIWGVVKLVLTAAGA